MVAVTALTRNSVRQSGESQPSCGACFRPISREASAIAISASEVRSSVARSAKQGLSRGSRNGVAAAATSPGATLIRNSQCQDQVSVIQPPTTGPTVGASTAMMPAIVVAIGCSRSGNSRNTAENTAGISVPPANPWSTRKADQRRKIEAERAADGGQRKEADRADKQPAQGQHARQPARQRDGDDFGDQIGRLNPAHRIARDLKRMLDRGQRGRDHLNVEDRHEHAEAHQDEAEPCSGGGLVRR